MDAALLTSGVSYPTDWSRGRSIFLRNFPWYDSTILSSDLSEVQDDFGANESRACDMMEGVTATNSNGPYESLDGPKRDLPQHFMNVRAVRVFQMVQCD
jgi:hypothetical protein